MPCLGQLAVVNEVAQVVPHSADVCAYPPIWIGRLGSRVGKGVMVGRSPEVGLDPGLECVPELGCGLGRRDPGPPVDTPGG